MFRPLPYPLLLPQANLDDSQMSSSPFLRALMTAVCKAAVKGEDSARPGRGKRHYYTRIAVLIASFETLVRLEAEQLTRHNPPLPFLLFVSPCR